MLAQLAPQSVEPGFILLVSLAFCAALALFAFWLWMLLDCAQTPASSSDYHSRSTWILVIVIAGWLGALCYFFMVRNPRLERHRSRRSRARRHASGHRASRPVPPR